MKAFTFRLDRILRLRTEAEQQRARAMGVAAREEAVLDQLCLDHEGYARSASAQAAPTVGERTSAGMLRARHLVAQAAAEQLDDAERARAEARKLADQERARLAEARLERRTLERLKERQHDNWSQESSRDEQKTMDEVAARQKGNGGR